MSPALYDLDVNQLTGKIIGAAITVHREVGPGLWESTYESCLEEELTIKGLHVQRQVAIPLVYRSLRIPHAYRIDMLVEDRVVVELKVVDKLRKLHVTQVLTYLRLADLRVGLLFNFNIEALAAGGVKRVLRGG